MYINDNPSVYFYGFGGIEFFFIIEINLTVNVGHAKLVWVPRTQGPFIMASCECFPRTPSMIRFWLKLIYKCEAITSQWK